MLPSQSPAIFTVSRLNQTVRLLLEHEMGQVWISGEISNFTQPASGHWYFTLKDDTAQVRCAMFRNSNRRVTFRPQHGQQVLVRANITLYEPRGDYQIIVESMQPAGEGLLQQKYEQLKAKLQAEGLFDQQYKKPLPSPAHCVGVITSKTGAALHDILHVLKRRDPSLPVIIYPAAVQGDDAPGQIVRAIELANQRNECDVLIVGRGGGSLEDLWAFNEEAVAEAVFQSRLPVLAGIGHEVDVTLADMTADLRAATPSHAAQLLWPARAELVQKVDEAEAALVRAVRRRLEAAGQSLAQYESALRWFSPMRHQARLAEQLAGLHLRLHRAARQWLDTATARHERLAQALQNCLSPARLDMLSSRVEALSANLAAAMPRLLAAREQQHDAARQRLQAAGQEMLAQAGRELDKLEFSLAAANPLAPLKRGYALVRGADGGLLRSVTAAPAGSAITVRLADGSLAAVVSEAQPDVAATVTGADAVKKGRDS